MGLHPHQLPPRVTPTKLHLLHLSPTHTLPGKVSLASVKHLLPAHSHNNIHLSMSTGFYSHTSWFSRVPFKSVNGLYSCTGYQPHYILNKYLCSKCQLKHPLDPITAVTESTATEHPQQGIINAWPSPFNRLISYCRTTATLGDRRNFTRTLIPNSLSNILRSPLPALSYTKHRNHLYTAMRTWRQHLKTKLQDIQQWLRDNSIPNLHSLQPDTTDDPGKILIPSTAHQPIIPLNSHSPKLDH